MKKWIRFMHSYRLRLAAYLLCEILSLTAGLTFIYYSKRAIDTAVAGQQQQMQYAIVGLLLCLAGGMLMQLLGSWINERTKAQMLQDVQQRLVQAQMRARWDLVRKYQTGDIMNRVQVDAQEVVQALATTLISVLVTALRLLSAFAFLYWMDPILALLLLALAPLVGLSKLYYKKLKRLNVELKAAESQLGNVVQENMRLRLPIRALHLFDWRWRSVTRTQEQVYDMRMLLLRFSTLSRSIVSLVSNTGFALAFLWGLNSLYEQAITFGTLSAFLQLVNRIQGPAIALMGYVPQLIRSKAALERVDELLEAAPEPAREELPLQKVDRIAVDGLSFAYEDLWILDGLQATFANGSPTAIVGGSGRGKTTLIRLLLALLEPQQGEITLHSQGRELKLHAGLRNNFAYVPQGDKLFSGTLRDNLTGDRPHTAQQLRRVLEIACADFVDQLPHGLDTVLGEGATGLSEGQAQRIALARALLQDAPICLFDEVTSALDQETSQRLMRNLLDYGRDKIMIFITHDEALAKACQHIIYIR